MRKVKYGLARRCSDVSRGLASQNLDATGIPTQLRSDGLSRSYAKDDAGQNSAWRRSSADLPEARFWTVQEEEADNYGYPNYAASHFELISL
jgi:hypothetical protein